jgi:hypothetical protein
MELLSDKYGWTPNQIREIPMNDIEDYLEIISMKNRLEQAQIKKHKK